MLIAQLRSIYCDEIEDLESARLCDNFSVRLTLVNGTTVGNDEIDFGVEVCTPKWLEERCDKEVIVMGKDLLIMNGYVYSVIHDYIERYCSRCMGNSWEEVIRQLAQRGWRLEEA